MIEGEDKNKKDESKGFAGLFSLVSDVDTPPPLATKKEPVSTFGASSNQAFAPSTTEKSQPQPRRQQNYHESPQPSSMSIGDMWVFGILSAIILGLFWFVISTIKQSKKPAPIPRSPAQIHSVSSKPATPNKPGALSKPARPVSKPKIYAYVTTTLVNLRAGAGVKYPVLGQLAEMSKVEVISQSESWTKVTTPETPSTEGFIASRLLHIGSYDEAKRIVCDVAGSNRPYSGEILFQAREGRHKITVNAGGNDTFVKMRSGGKTALAFYVRSHETGVATSVPDGTYEIMFASGQDFSRKCLEFVSDMTVIKDPQQSTFQVTSDGYYQYFQTAEYSLTLQHHGNMTPQTVNPDSFRE